MGSMLQAVGARAALVFVLVSIAGLPPAGPRAQDAGRHVVLVTIDGLRGDYLGEADRYGLRIPTLRQLMRDGSFSPRTLSVFPSLTGAAHTSLVTGTGTGAHGILGNNRFDPSVWIWDQDNYDRQPGYGEYRWIKVATLWSAARARGLRTAAVNWPQTGGAPIDYLVSIAAAATADESHARIIRSASQGWLDRVEQRLGPLAALDARSADFLKARVALEILTGLEPAFLAVHFSLTDSVQHAQGPGTEPALAALEWVDQCLAVLLDGVRAANRADRTTLVVTGDHGFLEMHTELAVNLPLVEAGLITRESDGRLAWQAMIAPHRGLGTLHLREGADPAAIDRARTALEVYARRYPGRFKLLSRADLDRYRADRDAVFGVEPAPGYVLDGRLTAPFAQPHARAAGHGYSPDTPGMETGLVMWGSGIRSGVRLPLTYTIDVAPTVALLLGVELPEAEGAPMVGVFSSPR